MVPGILVQAGFATIYSLYAWPLSSRLRLAQVLVAPTFQVWPLAT